MTDKSNESSHPQMAFTSAYSSTGKQAAKKERLERGEEIHQQVIKEGLQTASLWTAGAAAASLALQKGLGPQGISKLYQSIRPAYKLLLVGLVGTGAFFTQTDVSAMRLDREFAAKYSITKQDEKKQDDEWDTDKPFSWTQEGVKNWAIKNRFEIVGTLWLGTLGASLVYNFKRGDIAMAQKLINARMTAQSAAIAGIIGFGAVSSVKERKTIDGTH